MLILANHVTITNSIFGFLTLYHFDSYQRKWNTETMSARRVYPVYPEQQRREFNRRGFAPILIVLILISILIIGYLGLRFYAKTHNAWEGESMIPLAPGQTLPPTTTPSLSDETTNWKTYTNDTYKYSVRFPATMTLSVNNAGSSVLFKTQSGDGVKISVSDLRTIPSLRQDINTLLSSPIGYEVKEGKTIIRTVKKLDQFNLGGEQAIKVFGTEKDDVATVYSTAVYVIKNDFSYIINTEPTKDLNKEEELVKTLDQILASFKFLD